MLEAFIRRYTLKGWMTMNRETMLSDLAELGINGLDKLADGGVATIHAKYFPEQHVQLCKPIDIRALKISTEQVDEAFKEIEVKK
jgi:hypothetical protein